MKKLTCLCDGEVVLEKCCSDDGSSSCSDICEKSMSEGGCQECPIQEAVNRLAAYESTGLTPQQIDEMDKMYKALCEKMNQLQGKSE